MQGILNKIILFLAFAGFSFLFSCQQDALLGQLENKVGTIRLIPGIDNEGRPYYTLFYHDTLLLDTSYLGLMLEGIDLTSHLTLLETEGPETVSDEYELLHGKQRHYRYEARQYVLRFENREGLRLECQFQLSDNGVAIRYVLPDPTGQEVRIRKESTSFGFPASAIAWLQPMSKAKTGWNSTNPSYEEHYGMGIPVTQRSAIGEGYVFPGLFYSGNAWVLISEANLHREYCGSRLQYDVFVDGLRVTFPQAKEVFPRGALLPAGKLPFMTPWRIIALGDLADIVESTLGTDLAAPAIDMDTDWIEPGLASWSWILLKDDFITYETSREFIDYASKMGWDYCLIDVDWDQKIGYARMQELIDYAKSKNVGIILWYNSAGSWNTTPYTPRDKLVDTEVRKAEFARLQKMGVAGCKIDFFGGDGQSMIAYYHNILADAAEFKLLINFHGATLPRGWQRTYPHLMTMESIKGEEFVTFEQGNADLQPSHCTVIPFTRNVYDPMDFTPMVLDSIPRIQRRTTTAFELALPILFTSGIQHMAEMPSGMEKMPGFVIEYCKNIPVQWDETRFISGYPGKDIVIARRKGDTWYVAGINGENKSKKVKLELPFVKKNGGLMIYDEGSKIPLEKEWVKENEVIEIGPYGGFVIRI